MILSGQEIQRKLGSDISISPFDAAQLNPNSYNLLLHDELLIYEEVVLDMRTPNRYRRLSIPPEGLVLQPGQLYLGRTVEHTETHNLVPMVASRSSLTRLGLFVSTNSGFGNVGFCGCWTLELYCVQPIRIYAGIQICQILYHELSGEWQEYCSDKYQNATDIQPSMLFREIGAGDDADQQLELNFDELANPAS
ncbi:dCTP deaminase [Roseimaritima ulvae]|uniref:Deoxycytidine triphosphate deaminase n=1 Tax=Roseimaritima ulvae TaxID=980254 RepID=A0A5B9QYH9_9BACT|nr:dCTP deaminase [Roseimaritima ulvae]QEG38993.1 Deoxycytidine triphosphate deaminase [Roseimaritima ulvae]